MERLNVPKSVSQNVVIDLNTTLSLKSRSTSSMPPHSGEVYSDRCTLWIRRLGDANGRLANVFGSVSFSQSLLSGA